MSTPAFNAGNFARPALQSVAQLLIIVISMMSMVNPAQASGTVPSIPVAGYYVASVCTATGSGATPVAACLNEAVSAAAVSPPYCAPFSSSLSGTTCYSTSSNRTQCPDCNGPITYVGGTSYCPANSILVAGNCTCIAPFTSNGTSCIQERNTIFLVGLGGEVMPTKTLAAYAKVTKSDGSAKSGAQVSLILTVVPEDGGPVRGEHVGGISPNGGVTDEFGKLPFVFTAPLAGGTHTIHAGCANCTNVAEDTLKVPGCPVPPLSAPPFTDPVAAGFENGNRWRPDLLAADYQTKLTCVEDAITAAHGTYTGTSAYRPTQYQQHLYEIIKKDVKLKPTYMLAHLECQTLRNKVTGEMGGHGLKYDQDVAEPGTSRHESGTAFDLTPDGLSDAQLTPIYAGCGVSHTAVPSEPWHTQ